MYIYHVYLQIRALLVNNGISRKRIKEGKYQISDF
jgi:hypothetical protein